MKILNTRTLRGPNYWSIRYPKLIVALVDLEELATRPSNEIPGFYEELLKLLPSLVEHYCSPGCRGGFLSRVREGTMMGHIMEHIALEMQTLAGMSVGFGRTRETYTDGIYQVIFSYEYEEAGRYAARAAFRFCQSLVETGTYPRTELEEDLKDLREISAKHALGPSTEALINAAEKRGVPWLNLETREMLQLGYGKYQHRIQAALTSRSSVLGVELACDKDGTKQILEQAGVPVPRGTLVYSLSELEDAIEYLGGYPIVIKPLDGNHGRGISLDLQNWDEAEAAYDRARDVSKGIIVEHFYRGRDFRLLVVNNRLVAVAERVPAHVIGNGRNTVAELIEIENQDPRRGEGHDNVLTQISADETTDELLERQGFNLATVLEPEQMCYLRATANLSTGGIAIDRTDEIHPETVWLAERVSRIIGLDIAGIDVIASDIARPLPEIDGAIVEVNAAPGLRMHISPNQGTVRNVAEPILDMLFPPGTPARIPIVAVTGTNGKTTTTRLIAHLFRQRYGTVGLTTTDGIYINDHLVEKGDTTGPASAQVILKDPSVEMAVLESARGGILRSGLACQSCDIGVVLNVAADHLGLGDIHTLKEMAKLKAVVPETVHADGYAVLNADDELVAAMADRVTSKVAYFSMNPLNPVIQSHIDGGNIAALYQDGSLHIMAAGVSHSIAAADTIPMTLGGRAPFMIANALAACLVAYIHDVELKQIRAALQTFETSAQQTPGRMNLFDCGSCHVLVDYAHNPAGYRAVAEFVHNWTGATLGVIGGPGDRRNRDLRELGAIAATCFDQIIIKEDDDTRDRDRGEVAQLLAEGVQEQNDSANTSVPYSICLSELDAIEKALGQASEQSLVVIFPEQVSRTVELIQSRQMTKVAI
ncbi:MAG: cyanophycin synthetase [Cyanobacteria bacterium P01_F01_bin.42]